MKETRRLLPAAATAAAAGLATAAATATAAAAADRSVPKAPPGTKTAGHGRTNRLLKNSLT